MKADWISAFAGMTEVKKVIILGVEVMDVGREEALGMVREVLGAPATTPPYQVRCRLYPLPSSDSGQALAKEGIYITTPNPEIVLTARKDKELRSIINNSFLALPDGFGLRIAAWLLGQKLTNRIAGADFMMDICGLAEKEGWPVFLLGGGGLSLRVSRSETKQSDNRAGQSQLTRQVHRIDKIASPPSPLAMGARNDSIASQAAEKLRRLYPKIKIVGAESGGKILYKGSLGEVYHDPAPRNQFGAGFDAGEGLGMTKGEWVASDETVIDKINQSGAKVLFVGFGCPKQEKWLRDNLKKLTSVRMAMTVGGTFDYLAGRVRRAPQALRRLGLEWLWRLFREPTRLGRIWNATARFMWQVLKWRLRMQFSYRRNVVGFIVNSDEQVLIVKRATIPPEYEIDHWQLPQGGVEGGESSEEAIQREMNEEVSLNQLEITGAHPGQYKYEVPLWAKLYYGCHGQKQTIYYLQWSGAKDAVRLDQEELVDYRWVPIDKVVKLVHEVRQPMTMMAVEWYNRHPELVSGSTRHSSSL